MAKASLAMIDVLRATARQLTATQVYQWGHMGSCNCGFLGQQVTKLSRAEIHQRAMLRYGDWNEQLNDYCPTSGLPFDDVISELLNFGFDIDDLKHLERLSDPRIRGEVAVKDLRHNVKEHVVLYLQAWAGILERDLLATIRIPSAPAELREIASVSVIQ